MGLTLLALPDDTPQTMLQRADEALYMVKKNGRNNIAVNMPKKG
jgi:PleD family two-component response regulator